MPYALYCALAQSLATSTPGLPRGGGGEDMGGDEWVVVGAGSRTLQPTTGERERRGN